MVLVDTSVWIRFLANRGPYAADLEALLDQEQVAGHDLVYGELLLGDHGGRRTLLSSYERLHHAHVVPHRDVVAFVRARNLQGRGVGWVDVHVLASAIVGRFQVWTADRQLASIARKLGVAYEPSAS